MGWLLSQFTWTAYQLSGHQTPNSLDPFMDMIIRDITSFSSVFVYVGFVKVPRPNVHVSHIKATTA